jgi:hypothetical protein
MLINFEIVISISLISGLAVFGVILSVSLRKSFYRLQRRLDLINSNFSHWKKHVDNKLNEFDSEFKCHEKRIKSLELKDAQNWGREIGGK